MEHKEKEGKRVVGIDIGSSHISFWTEKASFYIENVAGRPADLISRKIFGERWLLGEEAIQNAPSLELIFPVRSGLIDTRNFHVSKEALRALLLEGLKKLNILKEEAFVIAGISPLALRLQKDAFIQIFHEVANKTVFSPSTFLVAYNEEMLLRCLVIDIGAGTTDIGLVHGTMPLPEEHTSIKIGGDFIDKRILELMQDEYPEVPFSLAQARILKEKFGTLVEKEDLEVELPTPEGFKKVNISKIIYKACRAIIPPIVEGIKNVLKLTSPEFWPEYLKNILLCGQVSSISGIEEVLKEELSPLGEVEIKKAKDLKFSVAKGGFKIGQDFFEDIFE